MWEMLSEGDLLNFFLLLFLLFLFLVLDQNQSRSPSKGNEDRVSLAPRWKDGAMLR
jgi:hypothetical protein